MEYETRMQQLHDKWVREFFPTSTLWTHWGIPTDLAIRVHEATMYHAPSPADAMPSLSVDNHVPALHTSHAAALCVPVEDTSVHSAPPHIVAPDGCSSLHDPHLHGGNLIDRPDWIVPADADADPGSESNQPLQLICLQPPPGFPAIPLDWSLVQDLPSTWTEFCIAAGFHNSPPLQPWTPGITHAPAHTPAHSSC